MTKESDTLLGPLVSEHSHTLLYRCVAGVITFLLLSICLAAYAAGGTIPALVGASFVLVLFAWFVRRQATERLYLHEEGLCLSRGAEQQYIRWSELSSLDVQWAYSGDPPGFFEASLTDFSGHRVVLRANWRDRESIDFAIAALSHTWFGHDHENADAG